MSNLFSNVPLKILGTSEITSIRMGKVTNPKSQSLNNRISHSSYAHLGLAGALFPPDLPRLAGKPPSPAWPHGAGKESWRVSHQ